MAVRIDMSNTAAFTAQGSSVEELAQAVEVQQFVAVSTLRFEDADWKLRVVHLNRDHIVAFHDVPDRES